MGSGRRVQKGLPRDRGSSHKLQFPGEEALMKSGALQSQGES